MNRNSLIYKITCNTLPGVEWSEPYDKCSFLRNFALGFTLRYMALGILTLGFTLIMMVIVGIGYEITGSEINGFLNNLVNANMYLKSSFKNMTEYYFHTVSFGYKSSFVGTWESLSFVDVWFCYSVILPALLCFLFFVAVIILIGLFTVGFALYNILRVLLYTIIMPSLEFFNEKISSKVEKNENFKYVSEKHSKFCTKINYE